MFQHTRRAQFSRQPLDSLQNAAFGHQHGVPMATIIIPVFLCLFLGPGVGQLYNKEIKKGIYLIVFQCRDINVGDRLVLSRHTAVFAERHDLR